MNNPSACGFPNCTNPPVAQYRQNGPDSSVHAYFACAQHEYTDPTQQTGTHQSSCTLFPCDCTPDQDPVGIDA